MGVFRDALAAPGLGAIAEVKRRSPSAGELRPDANPAELAPAFERTGAAAVSVLVDERFGGSIADLEAARASSRVPLLAKGFFSSGEELDALRRAGADAVLLLLRDLDDARMHALMADAAKLGLDTLVEAHDAEELERATALGAEVIGINARDLGTFEIDRRAQLKLVENAPRDRVIVAESAIASRAQGAEAELAGADAILVGSALMRASDPAAKLDELISRPLVKVCGLTREEDVAAAAEAGADLAGFVLASESPRQADARAPGSRDDALRCRPRGRGLRRRRRPDPALRTRRTATVRGTAHYSVTAARSRRSSTAPGSRRIRAITPAPARPKGASSSRAAFLPTTWARRSPRCGPGQ